LNGKTIKTENKKSLSANSLLQTCPICYIRRAKPWKVVGAKHWIHDDKRSAVASDHLSCWSNEKIQVNVKLSKIFS